METIKPINQSKVIKWIVGNISEYRVYLKKAKLNRIYFECIAATNPKNIGHTVLYSELRKNYNPKPLTYKENREVLVNPIFADIYKLLS